MKNTHIVALLAVIAFAAFAAVAGFALGKQGSPRKDRPHTILRSTVKDCWHRPFFGTYLLLANGECFNAGSATDPKLIPVGAPATARIFLKRAELVLDSTGEAVKVTREDADIALAIRRHDQEKTRAAIAQAERIVSQRREEGDPDYVPEPEDYVAKRQRREDGLSN